MNQIIIESKRIGIGSHFCRKMSNLQAVIYEQMTQAIFIIFTFNKTLQICAPVLYILKGGNC